MKNEMCLQNLQKITLYQPKRLIFSQIQIWSQKWKIMKPLKIIKVPMKKKQREKF